MKSIERRILKIEELIQMKYRQMNPEYKDMTDEEAQKIVHEVLNGPVEALFVHIPKGFVDVYRALRMHPESIFCKGLTQSRFERVIYPIKGKYKSVTQWVLIGLTLLNRSNLLNI